MVIGGGVIGLEFSWEIRKTGCEVTMLEALPHLMARVLDPESAEVLKERCEACGITVRTGAEIEKIDPFKDVKVKEEVEVPEEREVEA